MRITFFEKKNIIHNRLILLVFNNVICQRLEGDLRFFWGTKTEVRKGPFKLRMINSHPNNSEPCPIIGITSPG